MTGQANLFSRFGFQVQDGGKIDNKTRAFFSKFKGRTGPASPDLSTNASWAQIAVTINALIAEFVAQGWIQKGFDANETAYADAIRAVTMIPAATEWAYAPYEALREQITTEVEFVATENAYSIYDSSQWLLAHDDAAKAGRIGNAACDWRTRSTTFRRSFKTLNSLIFSWLGTGMICGRAPARFRLA